MLVQKMGFDPIKVATMEKAADGFSFFVIYGNIKHSVDFTQITEQVKANYKRLRSIKYKSASQIKELKNIEKWYSTERRNFGFLKYKTEKKKNFMVQDGFKSRREFRSDLCRKFLERIESYCGC